jgi:hypothetical protein
MELTKVHDVGGNAKSPYDWKDNQTEEDTTLCSENNFLRSYWILDLDEQTKGCSLYKGDSLCCQQKENTFPFLLLGYI